MAARPDIVISSLDADRLEAVLYSNSGKTLPGRDDLLAELERAEIVTPEQIPPNVVTMNSKVRFKADATGATFCYTLVYPDKVDDSGETLSILAPIGSALLGLAEGESIEWPSPDGRTLSVTIDEILYQPERAGDLHR
ncbi:transcription elongation factor GreA/GreB [Oceanococcus atlanticus]|uniref:Transcription elongation factor GreA/GreB n=1 Tax=Oceanococcus atlanticus TaxID=1317117 RepID=A0A1Y1SDX4_9GAMM|nr:nucleoside diphosphate kinase regulator [Oceanococcus atlanticus]ORE86394.1 transcription elongation factor GreA/GreB [Oceanococcus atlanticus]RZO83342.1 MAG: nucleoside diphosphate kinase regulator [Oceanococcus sp.]